MCRDSPAGHVIWLYNLRARLSATRRSQASFEENRGASRIERRQVKFGGNTKNDKMLYVPAEKKQKMLERSETKDKRSMLGSEGVHI